MSNLGPEITKEKEKEKEQASTSTLIPTPTPNPYMEKAKEKVTKVKEKVVSFGSQTYEGAKWAGDKIANMNPALRSYGGTAVAVTLFGGLTPLKVIEQPLQAALGWLVRTGITGTTVLLTDRLAALGYNYVVAAPKVVTLTPEVVLPTETSTQKDKDDVIDLDASNSSMIIDIDAGNETSSPSSTSSISGDDNNAMVIDTGIDAGATTIVTSGAAPIQNDVMMVDTVSTSGSPVPVVAVQQEEEGSASVVVLQQEEAPAAPVVVEAPAAPAVVPGFQAAANGRKRKERNGTPLSARRKSSRLKK